MSPFDAVDVPRAPRLGPLTAVSREDLAVDRDWYDVSIEHDLGGSDLCELNMQCARCVMSQFVGADMQRARLIDVAFEGCDLSGALLEDSSLTRVEFRNCRLSGGQFNASRLNDVRFIGCRMDGACLRMVHGERLWFEDCVLTEAEFYAAELAGARLVGCDLAGADFSQARIPDAHLVGSNVSDLRGVGGLQRPVIDPTQVTPFALSLLTLHGVVVQEAT